MPPTDFLTGAPCWIDLGSPDPAGAAAFYGAVFGWTFASAGPEAGDYGFLQLDGRTVGAIGRLTEDGARSAWTTYFSTPDADATARSAERAGGGVRVEPGDVFDAGRMAQLTDPQGAQFAIWQPGQVKGLDVVRDDNAFVWAELHTPDQQAALAFYRGLFGWRDEDFDAPGMTYLVLATAEGEDRREASFGGIAPVMDDAEQAAWLPYFAAADVDALVTRAAQAGGQVLMPGADVPRVGRIAVLADPFGAPFALIKGDPEQS
ncbi:VOC family protein [Kitasatospora sp. NPDC054939]